MWPRHDLLELFGIETPIIQAPMAGANGSEMVIAVSEAGGLGSLPCAMLDVGKASAEIGIIRQRTAKPFNVNFFCHTSPEADSDAQMRWLKHLEPYYSELGLTPPDGVGGVARAPFDEAMCQLMEEHKPVVVSFHFGLPSDDHFKRVKEAGCRAIASATTVEEAVWLEKRGCDAIIAQGSEAGGHRGMFLTDKIATQIGTFALVPQIVDAVSVPVIAAGGIADGRGIAAAFALGASGVQVGTAYLSTPESTITDLHRAELKNPNSDATALTNVFSGRPARGMMNRIMRDVGPMSDVAPAFPTAGGALAPLKAKAEKQGDHAFSSLWSGQGAALCKETTSAELTEALAKDALQQLKALSTPR